MNPADAGKEIIVRSSGTLARSATRSLATRGLADLESAERADEWLAKAEEYFSKEVNKLTLMDKGKSKWSTRKLSAWYKSEEHRAIMDAYCHCLRQAVAAKPNYPKALAELAKAYLNGWGVTESRDEALRNLRSAAASASPDELWDLSWIIKHAVSGGDPWPEGMLVAQKMCRKGAEQGNAGAQYSLGEMYVKGEGGLPCDDKLAMFWLRKAAEHGEFPPAEGEFKYLKSKSGGGRTKRSVTSTGRRKSASVEP